MRAELSSLTIAEDKLEGSSLKPSMSGTTGKDSPGDGVRTKILIADREGVFRLGLKKLFSVEDDLRVVAQAENSSQLLAMASSFKPDLMIVQDEIALDGSLMPVQQVHCKWPECKLIVTMGKLSEGEWERFVSEGASGVIARSAPPEAFVENVRAVISGENGIYPEQTTQQQGGISGQGSSHPRPVDTLTPRERTIISCLTQGWRNREIAQHLTITEQTVKNHLRSIYDKVGVSDRLELVLYAIHQRMELPTVDSYI